MDLLTILLWILAVALVVYGLWAIFRGPRLWGIISTVLGLIVGVVNLGWFS